MAAEAPRVDVRRFLDVAVEGNTRAGIEMAMSLLDAGMPADRVLVDLIGAAQREVGEQWMRNRWTVADEHVATAVSQAAVEVVAAAVNPTTHFGDVMVCCAEGDWHSLPARLAAEQLAARGWHVTFLGASTPAAAVGDLLARRRPDALVVSCSIPVFFAGVARLADAAHAAGVPVLAGGRALASPAAAVALGADAWSDTIDGAHLTLLLWRSRTPVLRPPTSLDGDAIELSARRLELAEEAMAPLCDRWPAMAGYRPEQLQRTREDLAYIVDFAAAAVLVDDETVFDDFLDWLGKVLVARGVAPAAVGVGLEVLQPLVEKVSPAASQLIADRI